MEAGLLLLNDSDTKIQTRIQKLWNFWPCTNHYNWSHRQQFTLTATSQPSQCYIHLGFRRLSIMCETSRSVCIGMWMGRAWPMAKYSRAQCWYDDKMWLVMHGRFQLKQIRMSCKHYSSPPTGILLGSLLPCIGLSLGWNLCPSACGQWWKGS